MDQSNLCPRFQKGMDIISRRWTGLIIYQLLIRPAAILRRSVRSPHQRQTAVGEIQGFRK